ncbi:MAG: hypothetical protein ABIS03_08590 [Gemmatimonadaceae bacterium]
MPLSIPANLPTLFIRKEAFERVSLMRSDIDSMFGLTDKEFRMEGGLIAIGPLPSDDLLIPMIEHFEKAGIVYHDDMFELSGNWPEWLCLFAMVS